MVFQNYALYPHMTVFRNLAYPLRQRRMPKREINKRVLEVAELLSREGLLKRRPAQLSGGQRQRVAMGRALVREPKVFDEPLSNLVRPTQTFHRLWRPRVAARLCPRILVQRCCTSDPASAPDDPRVSPFPAKRSGGAH
jgi:ABC-type sugar transport system ATPase subunit